MICLKFFSFYAIIGIRRKSNKNGAAKNMDKETDKTHDPHDTRMTVLFRNKEAFISFVKDCVKAAWANDIDEDSLRQSPKSYVLPDFKKKESDVVYEATLKKGKRKIIFFILLENQSRVDYRMNYRLLLYIVEILRDYYNNADEKARRRKNFKFPVVVPLVFYTGNRKWTVPLNLKEMFDGYQSFGDYVLNFNYALVDAKGYDDESVKDLRSKLLKLTMLFERSADFDEVVDVLKKYKPDIFSMNDEEMRIIDIMVDILCEVYGIEKKQDIKAALREKNAERVDKMLSNVIANAKNRERNIRKEGEQIGKKENAIETAKKMLLKNKPMDEIIEFTGLTEKEIRDIEKTI
jgi:predicted transposase/invertase (TIGR01784 family)